VGRLTRFLLQEGPLTLSSKVHIVLQTISYSSITDANLSVMFCCMVRYYNCYAVLDMHGTGLQTFLEIASSPSEGNSNLS
jgi:hypothetical protein